MRLLATMAELTHIGKHCTQCNQLDFLPIKCGFLCKQTFCKDCAPRHLCKAFMTEEEIIATTASSPEPKTPSPKKKCGIKKCKNSVTIIYCECSYCGKRTCFEHKDYHAAKCTSREESVAAEKKKIAADLDAKNREVCEKMLRFCKEIIPTLEQHEKNYRDLSQKEYNEGRELQCKRRELESNKRWLEHVEKQIESAEEKITEYQQLLNDAKTELPEEVAKEIAANHTVNSCKRHLEKNRSNLSQDAIDKIEAVVNKIETDAFDSWKKTIQNSIKTKEKELSQLNDQKERYSDAVFEIELQLESIVAEDINRHTDNVAMYKAYVVEIKESYTVFKEGEKMLTENGEVKVINTMQQMNYIIKLTSSVSPEVNRIIDPFVKRLK